MTYTITLTAREAGILQDLIGEELEALAGYDEDESVNDDADAAIQLLECLSAKITAALVALGYAAP
jgi:hypothetical protein